mmetsp:Transcript_2409/g.9320  ORF Transcript_2409/g.9320 Transcript_2409/m.9320 type:complete len:259 (+) Transcript_2409:4633-5409(+)
MEGGRVAPPRVEGRARGGGSRFVSFRVSLPFFRGWRNEYHDGFVVLGGQRSVRVPGVEPRFTRAATRGDTHDVKLEPVVVRVAVFGRRNAEAVIHVQVLVKLFRRRRGCFVFGLVATTAGVADFVARDVAARVVVVVVVVRFVLVVVAIRLHFNRVLDLRVTGLRFEVLREQVFVRAFFVRHHRVGAEAFQNRADVTAGVLKQLVVAVENHERDLAIAKHAELHGFFHEPVLALGERDLSVAFVRDPLDADLLATHGS